MVAPPAGGDQVRAAVTGARSAGYQPGMSNLIVTLTLNPAVDLASSAEAVIPIHKIRTTDEHIDPGGGGINVARVIHALGGETLALVLGGGATGRLIEDLLRDAGVPTVILPMAGRTRVSLTVYDQRAGQEYRFVPEGPVVTQGEWHSVREMLDRTEGGWLVASGSLPRGLPADAYAQVTRIAIRRGMRVVLDTSGEPLRAALHSGLTLIKPSLRELEHLVGKSLPDAASQAEEAMKLVRDGAAQMVVVTLGANGALLATPDGVTRMPALAGPVRSAVGAGDAFLASMVMALSRGLAPKTALAWGIAAGAAAVEGVGTARVSLAAVEACYRRLQASASESNSA
jgi:6-phosphofructokinase 2